ncbi:DUF2508 family protein [Paenibacillus pini]|uniref:DUF2508 domain-containing protein n=1 Tax=Paenibacillus pini JCM 16418 TaxID=1236976 RepID=W7YHU5_9BACL|nr:DUF2508 family protein [Paenibacillus pini]GAF10475.1 hypothetical protein JCM16418_4682 [Paenibacillus pini JCM 16418]
MGWFIKSNQGLSRWQRKNEQIKEQEERWNTYEDVRNARVEWEQARMHFEQAMGEDQIDYAIYMLEAAERKYQIALKKAKYIGLNRTEVRQPHKSNVKRDANHKALS